MNIEKVYVKASGCSPNYGSVYEIILKFEGEDDFRYRPRYMMPFYETRERAGGKRGDSFAKVHSWLNTKEGIAYVYEVNKKYIDMETK